MGRADSTSLAPGFRFHPTDEELVRYYLKRKVTNKPLRFDAISVIDIYKSEPWDLPSKSKLKSRDLEWYFFSVLDRKYANGSKTNRATEKGYWKTTGKDRAIKCNSQIMGMKKTLVYHQGRAPRGERSNWVMHEYRLADEQLEKGGIVQDAFVLCRIFQKSGTGPKNGEQYGAPFVEEEWDDEEEVVWIPDGETVGGILVTDEVAAVDNGYVENNDFDQNFDITVAADNAPVPLSFYYGETSNYVQYPQNVSGDDQKPIIGNDECHYDANLADNQYLLHSPGQYGMNTVNSVKEEKYVTEPSNNVDAVNSNFLLDEPYLDAIENPEFGEGLFLEANDLSNPVQPNAEDSGFDMVEEYLNFFDVNDDNLTFDPSELMGGEKDVDDQEKGVPGGSIEVSKESQKLADINSDSMESQTSANINSDWPASSSKQKPETISFESDIKYPFLKQASHMLGSIPAPPAFASEFPAKDAALRLHAGQSSGSVHVTAGIVRIENTILNGSGIDWSLSKNGNVNIILSFSLPQGDVCPPGLLPMANYFAGKMGSAVSRSWFLLMFLWILIISVTYKIGTCVCAK